MRAPVSPFIPILVIICLWIVTILVDVNAIHCGSVLHFSWKANDGVSFPVYCHMYTVFFEEMVLAQFLVGLAFLLLNCGSFLYFLGKSP